MAARGAQVQQEHKARSTLDSRDSGARNLRSTPRASSLIRAKEPEDVRRAVLEVQGLRGAGCRMRGGANSAKLRCCHEGSQRKTKIDSDIQYTLKSPKHLYMHLVSELPLTLRIEFLEYAPRNYTRNFLEYTTCTKYLITPSVEYTANHRKLRTQYARARRSPAAEAAPRTPRP